MTNAKETAALAALEFIIPNTVLGVGTGSTVDCFINALKKRKNDIEAAVSSSHRTTQQLKAIGVPVIDLNAALEIPLYVDGADAANRLKQLIKGQGGAMTQEKIIATTAKTFVCIMDAQKPLDSIAHVALPIEVIPSARSFVAREILKMGGNPMYRQGVVTDNHNQIIDAFGLDMAEPIRLEEALNQIEGVVCHGLFAKRRADYLLIGKNDGSCVRL